MVGMLSMNTGNYRWGMGLEAYPIGSATPLNVFFQAIKTTTAATYAIV